MIKNSNMYASLQGLDFSQNSFTGVISDFLSSDLLLKELLFIKLNNNFFSGPISIPNNNNSLDNLETIVLSQNWYNYFLYIHSLFNKYS